MSRPRRIAGVLDHGRVDACFEQIRDHGENSVSFSATFHKEHQMKTALFKIDGMHCDGCANTVKAMVERQPGVQAAEVSYDQGEARILYDPRAVAEDRLVAMVQTLGYRATPQNHAPQLPPSAPPSRLHIAPAPTT